MGQASLCFTGDTGYSKTGWGRLAYASLGTQDTAKQEPKVLQEATP